MLEQVTNWLKSNTNIFKQYDCKFEVSHSPQESDTKSITVDFEYNSYYCRLIFWDNGLGHIEVIDIESEKPILDQSFTSTRQLETSKPFENFIEKMSMK
ncbi:hypothetical protein GTG28_07580 [Vibrio sp. OCN044]|uniref:Uncharacterized protein n=1 Tax=Vibrio tetraodonis subsp. pristinus TaxID=2695891 RepID=A0A6L8LSL2_9VIBR|nr:hypothetical protein [Vibrio tetraodonis]MYM59081.1 hypothetical protein [Vibrio tetraodonis subsp. pristinus]